MRTNEHEICGRSLRWYDWLAALLLFGLIVAYCAQRFAAESSFEQLPNRRWG